MKLKELPAARLCYIDGDTAYFTTQNVCDQWGDDWDVPYEHNAGLPYTWNGEADEKPWQIVQLKFSSDLVTPDYGVLNSQFSVIAINAGMTPWLRTEPFHRDGVSIFADATITEFVEKIHEANGTIYWPLEKEG